MQTSEPTMTALVQMFVLSLIVERVVAVIHALFAKPVETTDAPQSWGALGIVLSICAGLLICEIYAFDVVSVVVDSHVPHQVGIVTTAVVIAGGSAGVRAIIDVFSNKLKANNAESRVRIETAIKQVKLLEDISKG
ncbi:Uncharacterised protein [Burkholderia pseudomallei]|nr:Uncharacterised protein [Burkholderia pseudomallei]